MKTLPVVFAKSGFTFTQLVRKGNVAIYEQCKDGAKHYEVGRIRSNKEREAFGVHFEASESWPTSEEWGIRAWTYQDLASAIKRFDSLHPSEGENPILTQNTPMLEVQPRHQNAP